MVSVRTACARSALTSLDEFDRVVGVCVGDWVVGSWIGRRRHVPGIGAARTAVAVMESRKARVVKRIVNCQKEEISLLVDWNGEL